VGAGAGLGAAGGPELPDLDAEGSRGRCIFDAGGRAVLVVPLDIADDQVQTVRTISNPDKLRHLAP
jgi:RNA polymerase sigma-70 factor, ECF subfamily